MKPRMCDLQSMNLWHLFATRETYKLDTFLQGGLWCSDLGSIVGFGDDSEGSGLHGVFVSCWHLSPGDPTSHAWQIFGGNGDGFAIRTSIEVLRQRANAFDHPPLKAELAEVQYVKVGGTICDPAFQVPEHHQNENEMRFAIILTKQAVDSRERCSKIQEAVSRSCSGRNFQGRIEQLTLSVRDDSDFALVLPIDTSALVKEILIGPLVSSLAEDQVKASLHMAGVSCIVRRASTASKRS